MSFTPITGTALQYMQDSVAANNHYIKFYASGTDNPISMAIDSTGGTLLAKAQFNSQGYAINGSGAEFIPHIDQKYKIVFYPNATDADNNTFANAVFNIDLQEQFATLGGAAFTKNFATLALAAADSGIVDGDALDVAERTTDNGGGFIGDVVLASAVTPNTYNIIISVGVPTLAIVIREEPNIVYGAQRGIIADGDSSLTTGTDNSAAWQAIIDGAPNNGLKLYLPNGAIKIETPVDYGVGSSNIKRISTEGANGTNGTIVFTDTAISALVRLPQAIGDTNNVAGSEFISIDFAGKSNANYCVEGFGNHMLFRDCRFRSALLSGTDVSQGWDNMYDHCYWLDNIVDGESMAQGQNNQNSHVGCKFVNNGRFGVFGRTSLALSYDNCLFENNGSGAFFGFGCTGVTFSDSCYFDQNGQDGHIFTTPSKTVYADVILNGSSSTTTMTVASPCSGVTIDTSFVSGNAVDPHTHVYAISSIGLEVRNTTLNSGDVGDLVTTYGSTTTSSQYSRNEGLRIGRENNFDNKFVVENSTSAFAGKPDMLIDGVQSVNIADDDLNSWVQNVAGSGGTWTRSAVIHDGGPNIPVWEMVFGSTSTSDRQGFAIDSADYPQLAGKPCVWTVDVKAAASNTPTITITGNGGTRSSTSTDWFALSLMFNMPASGSINFDVKKGSATGIAYFANPVLCELGADTLKLGRRIPLISPTFRKPTDGTLAPTAGTWANGDTVIHTAPPAGGNREAVCTTGGTPGTWKSCNAIDA